jgi:hypothetical protein
MDIAMILTKKFAGALWSLNGDEYAGLEWFDDSPKPTKKQLEALWPEVQYETVRAAVQAERQAAYIRDADPLFFGYQRGENTEQEWLDAVQAVKDAHPYPEAD